MSSSVLSMIQTALMCLVVFTFAAIAKVDPTLFFMVTLVYLLNIYTNRLDSIEKIVREHTK